MTKLITDNISNSNWFVCRYGAYECVVLAENTCQALEDFIKHYMAKHPSTSLIKFQERAKANHANIIDTSGSILKYIDNEESLKEQRRAYLEEKKKVYSLQKKVDKLNAEVAKYKFTVAYLKHWKKYVTKILDLGKEMENEISFFEDTTEPIPHCQFEFSEEDCYCSKECQERSWTFEQDY